MTVPLKLAWNPTYKAPDDVHAGQRVRVRLGARIYDGVVVRTGTTPSIDPSRVLPVFGISEGLPDISPGELELWQFIADYYMCTLGEVFKTACPAGKIRSEQKAANILQRLQARLAVREEALTRKHKDSVRERLEAEKADIGSQIAALTRIPLNVPETCPRKCCKPELLTGPGRTEIYIDRCGKALQEGYNILVLVPDSHSGEQLTQTLEEAFPGQVHNYNALMTAARKRRIADDVRNFGAQIVVGTRSAIFLPLSRLGLVIIDNEQDISYKQQEPSPRYNARDAAVMLARIHGAEAILGTPAPSAESWWNRQSGKYTGRVGIPATGWELIDVGAEKRKRGMLGCLSRKLAEAAAAVQGPVALIRGWEKPEELGNDITSALPDREVTVFSWAEARRADLSGFALVAVIQADSLLGRENFRTDERALQALMMLGEAVSGKLIIQTARPEHPVFSHDAGIYDHLLKERRDFNLPPFTRLVDIHRENGDVERVTLMPGASLSAGKQKLIKENPGVLFDVDPL